MLKIDVKVEGNGAVDKVAAAIKDGLLTQMSATPWCLTVEGEDFYTRTTNEGRKR